MPTELTIRAVHESGLRMTATNGVHTVTTDYPLQGGQAAGFTPMELLLVSLATCGGSVVALLLKRAGQAVTAVEAEARGERRDEHPTVFTSIKVDFVIRGTGIEPALVEKVIASAEGHLCPVWAMLKPAVNVATSYRLIADERPSVV